MTGPLTRDVGGVEFLRGALPGVALDGLALLTWLGSVPLAAVILTAIYWFGSRERGAVGLGAGLGAVALTVGLKALFALPRPPESVRLVSATGFGFPSGHAIVATVIWGYLALAVERGTRERRLVVAALVVGLVGVSRVALGVHHAVDVVVGVAVGGVFLLVVSRIDGAGRTFVVSAVVASLAVVATGGSGDALLLTGGAVTGALLWPRLSVPSTPWRREGLLPAVGGSGSLGALALVGYRWELAGPLEFAIGAVTVAGVLALPALVRRPRAEGETTRP